MPVLTHKTAADVVRQLVELRRKEVEYSSRNGADEYFSAEQNARLIQNAEAYCRSMFSSRVSSWNLRDRHMADTLDAIAQHLGPDSKIVVWAHNSHLGDARATQMGEYGELNLGQLVREQYEENAYLIGFTTDSGTVAAASHWDGPAQKSAFGRLCVKATKRFSMTSPASAASNGSGWICGKTAPSCKSRVSNAPSA